MNNNVARLCSHWLLESRTTKLPWQCGGCCMGLQGTKLPRQYGGFCMGLQGSKISWQWAIGITNYQATLAMWGVLHGFAGCQASSAMGGIRHSAFVPFSHPPPRSKGASVNCKGLQWCTVGSVPLDSPLVWGACCALRTSGVRDA